MAGENKNSVSITVPSGPEQVSVVDEFLENHLRERKISDDIIADLAIAVTELVNNAIKHGNKNRVEKKVIVCIVFQNNKVEISITDEGDGFDPETIPDPVAEENLLKEIGRGVFIVNSLMDSVEYSFPSGGGTRVAVTKKIV